jgi:threonine dehydrogenase-like Zn-dependent dehydrogenase
LPRYVLRPYFHAPRRIASVNLCLAEYVRVPNADHSCIPVAKDGPADEDYLFISDIWSTAWNCLNASGFQAGDTVAVFGVGPVGLLCVYSAFLRGASRVYAVDHVAKRLHKAASMGAIPIDFTKGKPSEQIMKKEPLGVMRSCNTCGYECLNEKLEIQENYILTEAINVTAYSGGIGIVGIYISVPKSEGAPRADTVPATLSLPFNTFWAKGLSMTACLSDPKPLARMLLDLVNSGRATPGLIVSDIVDIEEAPEAYRKFDKKIETKVLIRFPWQHGN